jgi:hypothetical protein
VDIVIVFCCVVTGMFIVFCCCRDRNVKGPGCDDLGTQISSPAWDTDDDMCQPKAKHAKVWCSRIS